MNDGVDDVEEDFVVDLDWFRTNGTTKSADNLEHGITSTNSFHKNKKSPARVWTYPCQVDSV
jgi:hypothetical protein